MGETLVKGVSLDRSSCMKQQRKVLSHCLIWNLRVPTKPHVFAREWGKGAQGFLDDFSELLVPPFKRQAFVDWAPAGSTRDDVEALLRQMTSEERVAILSSKSPAIQRLNLTSFNWWTGATLRQSARHSLSHL